MLIDVPGSKFVAETNTRQASRAPVTLKIKFKSETLDQFIERYSVDISHGGIFIRTKDPLAVGTSLKFEFQLKDATPLIIGEGTVVWTREPDAKRAGVSPGMGVRFDKLPNESQKVLDAVLAKKGGKVSSEVEPLDDDDDDAAGDFVDSPTRVAPAGLVDSLVGSNEYDEGDLTPLPKPMPFHGDVDDFSDEAFNESTKVASLDMILAQAKGSAETDESAYDDDAVFASTSGSGTSPAIETKKPEKASKVAAPALEYEDPFADLNDDEPDEDATSARADSERADTRAEASALSAAASSNIITSTDAGSKTDDSAAEPIEGSAEDVSVAGLDAEDADADDDEAERAEADADASDDADAKADDDHDDDELDDDDDGINPLAEDAQSKSKSKSEPSQSGAARAAVLESGGDDERGSSMPWIAVAAVILLIGGVGGFWLLNKGDKDKQSAPAANSTVPALTDNLQHPDTAAQDPSKDSEIVEAPAALTSPVTITTVPEGARLSVDGTELQAVSPATFDLEAGKTYTVHVQHDAFLPQRVEVVADGKDVEPITLAPKPKVLRITSEPPGAIVLVNGQRLRGRTPVDLPVTTRMAATPSVRIQLRLPGYQPVDTRVPTTEGFEPTETELINSFTAQLKQAAARPNPGPQKTTVEGADANSKPEPTGTDDKATDKATKAISPGTESAKKPEPKPEPKTPGPSEPTPDWMK